MTPLISIIIPCYNSSKYIEQCILSIINQTFKSYELIIIDGKSNDRTINILLKYKKFINFFLVEKDKGQSNAMNKGLKIARGKFVSIMDSDDFYDKDVFLRIYLENLKNRNLDIIVGNGKYFNQIQPNRLFNQRIEKNPFYNINNYYSLQTPSIFWKKALHDKYGLFNEKLHYTMDWEFFIRIKPCNLRVLKINQNFSLYRHHIDHKSSSGSNLRYREVFNIGHKFSNQEFKHLYKFCYMNKKTIKNIKKKSPRGIWRIIIMLKFPITFIKYRRNFLLVSSMF